MHQMLSNTTILSFLLVFLKNPNQTVRNLPIPLSSSAKLNCSARARPEATIKWYKFESGAMIEQLQDRAHPFVHVLKNLLKNAKYMCNVSNALGYRTRTFKIRVFGKS